LKYFIADLSAMVAMDKVATGLADLELVIITEQVGSK
jgi:hypothetical protein